jgi:zinc D-Ala-D-Ala carboxypeptidase
VVMAQGDDAAIEALHAGLGIVPGMLAGRGLQRYPEAGMLVLAETTRSGRRILLEPAARDAWAAMRAAATADGLTLWLVSGHRSRERQAELIRDRLARGETIEAVLRLLAPPGYSEHHTGRAIDVTAPGVQLLQREFAATAAYGWLERRAGEFGFRLSYPQGNATGYDYEPWHWCHHVRD